MAKSKKSTRKFQAKHLGRAIQQRRVGQNKKRKLGQDSNNTKATHKQNGHQEDDEEEASSRPPKAVKPKRPREEAAEDEGEDEEEEEGGEEDDLDVDEFLTSGLIGGEEGEDAAADEDEEEEDDGAETEETEEEAEARLMAEIEEHEAEMKALAKSDPAFYKHLQDNDAELLQFNKADLLTQPDNEEEEEEQDDEAVDGAPNKKKKKAVKTRKAKTDMSLQQWRLLKRQVSTVHSISGLRKVLRLFRAAAHANDEEKAGEDNSVAALRFSSSTLFTDVIQFSVTRLPAVFTHHLSPPTTTSSSASSAHRSLASHPKFKTVGPLLKTYLAAYIHLLSTQHDSKMIRLLLQTCLTTLTPLFDPYTKLALRLLKHLITLWSTADRSTRIDSFLCVRQLCVVSGGKGGLLEEAMRAMYLTYVSYARFTSGSNVGVLEFMCIVELYGLDGPLAYQHAFVYIRQLAIHLRNATQGGKTGAGSKKGGGEGDKQDKRKTRKGAAEEVTYKAVYNWQFINCIRCWQKVLSSPLAAQPAASTSAATTPTTPATLRPLLYPFVQVCLGVLTLLPSSRYHPLRLTVINFLTTLSTACHLYIPLVPSILSLFSSPELTRKPTSTSAKSPDIRFLLKVSKTTALTRGYQEQITSAALRSLVRFYALHSYSLAYPELMLVATRYLRRWTKQSKIGRLKKEISAVVTQLEWNGEWVKERRERLDVTPKDCVTGKVDAMYAVRGVVGSGGKEEVSPLEKYVKMEKGESEGSAGDVDWEGKQRDDKRGTGDQEEDERDEEEDEGEEGQDESGEEEGESDDEDGGDLEDDDDDPMMIVDGEDVEDDEEESEEEEPVRKPANKKQKPAVVSSKAEKASKATKSGTSAQAVPQKGKRSRAVAMNDDEDEGDIVTELVLSDDDD